MSELSDRAMIQERCDREGLRIFGWTVDADNGETALLGQFEVIAPECEDDGLYLGDEGALSARIVGAVQYHNRRVCFSLVADGYDEGNEVRDLTCLEPCDV